MVLYFICLERKIIFSRIPKCAAESIRYLILNEQNKYKVPSDIWRKMKPNIIGDNRIHRNYLKFDFIYIVRNPYYRLVSGYINKVMDRKSNDNFLPIIKNILKNNYDLRVSFEEFIKFIIKQNPKSLDLHFMPQHLFLKFQKGINHNIFKLEKDVDKLNIFLEKKGFNNKFINFNKEVQNNYLTKTIINEKIHKKKYPFFKKYIDRKQIPNYESFYTDELKELVYNYYKNDFKLLGYKK
jgi:hypothetical protein